MNTNLPKLSQGDYSSLVDSRNRRDAASTSVTVASFKVLLSSLTKLTSLADSELAALAQQTSAYIQSTNNVAVN